MNIKAQIKAKLDEQRELLNRALAESRGLSEDEQAKIEKLETEVKALEKTQELQNKLDAQATAAATPVNDPIYATPKVHAPKWSNMGEYLQAVRDAYKPGGSIDNRLTFRNLASGLNEGVSSEGGFLLENDFVTGLQQAMTAESVLAKAIRMVPIGDNTNRLKTLGIDETSRVNGSRWGGVQAYWAAEADTVTASKPKFRDIDMKLEKLISLCYATDELLADSIALEAVIRQAYAEEMAYKVDDAILFGTGVGIPLGIMNSGALVTQAKETNQTAATVNHANITKMWQRLIARSRPNAMWVVNQDVETFLMDMTFTSGGNTMMSPYADEFIKFGTIKGRPVRVIEQAKTVGTAGDIILLDPTQYLGIDKTKAKGDVSIHVRFLYDESVFRFTYRFNGQPYRTAPVTPANGSNTLSNFVALATRG